MGLLDRLFGRKAPAPTVDLGARNVVVACTSCGQATNTREVMNATVLAMIGADDLMEAFDNLPWVDAAGSDVWSGTDPEPAASVTAIVHQHLRLRDSPELRQLGAPVGDGSGIPIWSTSHVAGLMRRLEGMGYATYQQNANGWVWPVLCPRCQELRLTGRHQPTREPSARLRDPVQPRLRFTVMQRDGFRCVYCGRTAAEGAKLHVDHVVPVAAGGPADDGNLVTACEECNLGKGAIELP